MSAEHFHEVLYTVLFTTKASKGELCRYLRISKVTLNKYLRNGLTESQKFRMMDKLESFLFKRLGGSESGKREEKIV